MLHAFLLAAVVATGLKAPDFVLKDETGKEHKLSDYKGKHVVLEWTNSKCPYVVDHYERGTMKDLSGKYGAKDVVWLAVNSTPDNEPKATTEWKKKWSLSFPTLQDGEGKVGKLYGATNTPQMYVIDKEGVLRYQGAIDSDVGNSDPKKVNYVDTSLTAMLAGKAPDPGETKPYGCGVKYK